MIRAAIIWKYVGQDQSARHSGITDLQHPEFKVIPLRANENWAKAVPLIPQQAKTCVFWLDDDKPVRLNFVQEMIQPLSPASQLRSGLHFWAGNALAVSRELLEVWSPGEFTPTDSLWKLLSSIVDVAAAENGVPMHVAFSSIERFAPLMTDPVGIPS
jgi:hypothetical protein